MNRNLFKLVFSKALGLIVVAPETATGAHKSARGSKRRARSAQTRLLPFVFSAVALAYLSPCAFATDLPLPSGALMAIDNGTSPNSASYNTINVYQNYSLTYTPTASGNNYILFAFRQDPAYWTFGNVSLTAAGSSVNLFADPTFTQGGTVSAQSGLQAPADWGIVYQTGSTPNAAGHWEGPGSSNSPAGTNINSGTAGSWYDGAVGSFDGIFQGVDLTAGTVYTISFTALSNDVANNDDVEMGVFGGLCLVLTGNAGDCTPANSDFTVLATPSQTANAGVVATDITATSAAAGLAGSPATLLPVFDGGTLTLDGTSLTPYTFTITGNNGSIDLAGQSATISNAIANDSAGVAGGLTVTNTGQGGALDLTAVNTYTGSTTIASGATLDLVGAGSIATSSMLTNNGTFDVSQASSAAAVTALAGSGAVALGANNLIITDGNGSNFSGVIAGTGAVQMNSGMQVFSGANTYTGGTELNGGALAVSADNNLGAASGALTFNAGTLQSTATFTTGRDIQMAGTAYFNVDAGTTLTDTTGAIAGNGGLYKFGAGTLVLGALNANGGADVAAGELQLTGAGSGNGVVGVASGATLSLTGAGAIANASSVVDDGTFDISGAQSSTAINALNGNGTVVLGNNDLQLTGINGTFAGGIGGSGAVRVSGAATLSGTSTYTGGTTVDGGTLGVSADANLGAQSGGLTLAKGTLASTATFTSARNIGLQGYGIFDVAAGTTLTDTVGQLSGSGSLIKAGTGTLVLGGITSTGLVDVTAGRLDVTGLSTDTAVTFVETGATLALTGNGSIASSSNVVNYGSLDLTSSTQAVSLTSLAGTGTVALNGQGLTLTGAHGSFDGSIGGAGGLTIASGTERLTGTNTYTGGTTVQGNLTVSSDANLGAASGELTLAGGSLRNTASFTSTRNIVIDGAGHFNTDTGTVLTDTTGVVSGNGQLIKDGAGTLVLGSVNSTGGIDVGSGTLQITGAGTGTGAVQVNAGSTLALAGQGSIADASSVTADGSLDLTQATAPVAIRTLAGSGSVTLGGTGLVLTNASDTFAGVIGGAGSLTLNGGTETLTGNNTYTGGTVINGGNLQVSSDNNLGATGSSVTFNGGTLTATQSFDTSRNMVINSASAAFNTLDGVTVHDSGDISGSGSLVKLGGGTLVVSGNNSFTGGTLIDGGMVIIDQGSSLGSGAIVLNGGTLQTVATLSNGNNVLVSGDAGVDVAAGTTTLLSGSLRSTGAGGCFVKSGAGALNLTGNAVLANGTCVQDGILRANGMLESNVTVDSAGELRGVGLIVGPISVSGRLAPGNSPGTLTVNGTVTMNAGSSFEADIDGKGTGTGAGNYSRLLITGATSQFIAGGTLIPQLRGITGNATNTYTPTIGDTYRIVTAEGGIVGRFASLQEPTTGLPANSRFVAFYNVAGSNSIDLSVVPDSYASLLAGTRLTRNGQHAAGLLDTLGGLQVEGTATTAQSELLYAISTANSAQIGGVVTSLSGQIHADEAAAVRSAGLAVQSDAVNHLVSDDTDSDHGHKAWTNLTHDGNRAIGDNQASGYQTGTNQASVGVDVLADAGSVLGLGGTHHETNVIASGGQGTIRGDAFMVYGQHALGVFLLDGVASYGNDNWSTRRPDPTGIAGNLSSTSEGHDLMGSATLRMPLDTASAHIEPYATVIWQQVKRNGFDETGVSPAALQVDALSANGTRVMAGLTAGSKAHDPLDAPITWRVGAALGADSGGLLDPSVHAVLAGESFDTRAPHIGRGFVQLNASGTMLLSKSTYLYGSLTGEQGKGRAAYGVTAGVRVAF